MEVQYKRCFVDCFEGLSLKRQKAVLEAIESFVQQLQSGQSVSDGLGLTKMTKDYWEIRSNLSDRIIFNRFPGTLIIFRFVGSHDEVRRFIRSN